MNAIRSRWVWSGVVVALVAVLAIVSAGTEAEAQTVPFCPTGLTINLTSGATVTGVTPLQLGVPTSATTLTIDKVFFKLDGKLIGQARRSTANPSLWAMPWPTQLADPGAHQLQSHVFYNQTMQCVTQTLPINVAPSASAGTFGFSAQPTNWSGLTNTSIDIAVTPQINVGPPASEANQYVVYQWETNIGSVAPTLGVARFFSGATAGSGRVLIRAYYGGKEAVREVPIQVLSQVTSPTNTSSGGTTAATTPTSTTSTSTNATTTQETVPSSDATSQTTTTATNPAPLTKEEKVQLIARQVESQPEVLSCATQNLTQARIDELRTAGRRLSTEEFLRMRGCFAQTSYVVPASYAPAEPEEVRAVMPEATNARIKDMKTQPVAADEGVAKNVLRFEGQAEPNSDVLLYVFSEPLVLYAKADDQGNWVYELVDPMEPGNHEAYAVVESSDGTYRRSSAFSFLIETAQASSENPNGYSLSVQTVGTLSPPASKGRISLYVIGSGIVVLLVLIVGGYVVMHTMKHIPEDDSTGTGTGI